LLICLALYGLRPSPAHRRPPSFPTRRSSDLIRASTESYSLKDLEKIYWGKRSGEVTNAGDSIVEYERWRELGDQAILDAIERYKDRKSTRLNSSHVKISYAVFCLKKKRQTNY